MKIKIIPFLAATFFLLQCTTQKTVKEVEITSPPKMESNLSGEELYADNCAMCHKLYSPNEFSAKGWDRILADMIPRTELSENEASRIKEYLYKEAKNN